MAGRNISDRLAGLKFMQRARAKEELKKTIEEEKVKADSSHWVAPGREREDAQCRIVMERDPLPGAITGRMSFGGFNASLEKLMEAQQGSSSREKQAEAAPSVSDTEMADRFLGMRRDMSEAGVSTTQQKRKVQIAKEPDNEVELKRQRSFQNGHILESTKDSASPSNPLGSATFQYPRGVQSMDAKETSHTSRQGGWRDKVDMKNKMLKK